MKPMRWKWALPLVLLAFAFVCHIYEPHEYRVGLYRDRAFNNPSYYGQRHPAWVGRISKGINFPALVLAYPLRNEENAIFERNSSYTLIWISPSDIGFFVGVVLFWCWVGARLDRSKAQTRETSLPHVLRIGLLACGLVFGLFTAAFANQMLDTQFLPERQVGVFGVAWSCALVAYFGLSLGREFGARLTKTTAAVVAVVVAILGLVWIGGPWGATQALGECLRPTAARVITLPAQCTENEKPPDELIQAVQSQAALQRLELQKVLVCRSNLNLPQGDPRFVAVVIGRSNLTHWLPLQPAGHTFQFRRHFIAVTADERGNLIVEVALVQSRWDYLRQNWNKIRAAWFWPYEGTKG